MQDVLKGKYRILHEVGQGGMAVVYKGVDLALDREVAVKVLHPHLASRADSRMRFQREAKAVAKLRHSNIVEIYDYSGLESEESFIVTEYIRGETLKDFTDRTCPTLPEIGAMISHQVASALAHAHSQGIIHRDVKPENVMIRDDGVVKLMDFGIAQIVDMQQMTVTGALVGSPAYMSPEHVEGRPLDYRADVFSMGTMLYFLTTGKLPFDATSPHALLRQILEVRCDDPRTRNPAISRGLQLIIRRCHEREAEARFPTMVELEDALLSYLRELDLGDPARELTAYFDDPKSVEASLTRRVIDRLMARARVQADAGSVPAALEAYNQVLALAGDETDAMTQVQRLTTARSRQTAVRRLLMAAAAVGAIGGVLTATRPWRTATTEPEDGPEPAVVESVPAATPIAVAPAPAPVVPVATAPTSPEIPSTVWAALRRSTVMGERQDRRSITTEAPPRPVAALDSVPVRPAVPGKKDVTLVPTRPAGDGTKAVASGVTFSIRANPPAAEIHFDGQTFSDGRTPKLTRQKGTYSVRIHHPSCDYCEDRTYRLTIDPAAPPPSELVYEVGFKPALVTVEAPSDALIEVGGRRTRPGQAVEIKMRRPKETIPIHVHGASYEDVVRNVTAESGRPTTVTVNPPRLGAP